MIGGIMAGGEGRRLTALGATKPLLAIGGRPLIAHVFEQFQNAHIYQVILEVSEGKDEIEQTLTTYCPREIELEVVRTRPGGGTGSSVRRILQAAEQEDCLISTVDTVAPTFAFRDFRAFTMSYPGDIKASVLTTTMIHDEMPIWVHVGVDAVTVTDFGKLTGPSPLCFGNARWLSRDAIEIIHGIPMVTPESDSILMQTLVTQLPGTIKQFTVDPIFDVDTPEDAALASAWLLKEAPIGDNR